MALPMCACLGSYAWEGQDFYTAALAHLAVVFHASRRNRESHKTTVTAFSSISRSNFIFVKAGPMKRCTDLFDMTVSIIILKYCCTPWWSYYNVKSYLKDKKIVSEFVCMLCNESVIPNIVFCNPNTYLHHRSCSCLASKEILCNQDSWFWLVLNGEQIIEKNTKFTALFLGHLNCVHVVILYCDLLWLQTLK